MQEGESITGQSGATYRLMRRLGQPGLFGEAFLAISVDTTTSTTVAVKALRGADGRGVSTDLRDRFMYEADTLNRVRAAHGDAPLYSIKLLDQSLPDASVPFLVLEQATGQNVLYDMVEPIIDWRHAPPSTHEMLTIAAHLVEALIIVHKAGICYDDLKLDNLFWEPNRSPPLKIIDWNVTSDLAQRGESGDWARFGARLLQMLTGYRLGLDRDGQIIAGSWHLAPTWPQLSLGIQQIISRALHPNLSQRYHDGAEVRDDLGVVIEALSLSRESLISQTRQALGQRRYDEARIYIDYALRADPESAELRQLLDAVERGRGRARQDWIDVGVRLLQRGEFTDAIDRFDNAYHDSGSADGHARRLSWAAEACRNIPGGYASCGEQILAALNALAGDLDRLDRSAADQAVHTLAAIAEQYPQQKQLIWLAAEASQIHALASLSATDVTETTARAGYLDAADAALRQLPLTTVVDLARRRDELPEQRRLLEDQQERQDKIKGKREFLAQAIRIAEQVLRTEDLRGLPGTIKQLRTGANTFQSQVPAPNSQDAALLQRARFLSNMAPLREQISTLREQMGSPALEQREAALHGYARWRDTLDNEAYTFLKERIDEIERLAEDTRQARQLYTAWVRSSGPEQGYGILRQIMALKVYYGPSNNDLQAYLDKTIRTAGTTDPAIVSQIEQQVALALSDSLEDLAEGPLQIAERKLAQYELNLNPAYAPLIDKLIAKIEQRRRGLDAAKAITPQLRDRKEADYPHDLATAARWLHDINNLQEHLTYIPTWASDWQHSFDALFESQLSQLSARASIDSLRSLDNLTSLRADVQQLRADVGDIPAAVAQIEQLTRQVDDLSAQLVAAERSRSKNPGEQPGGEAPSTPPLPQDQPGELRRMADECAQQAIEYQKYNLNNALHSWREAIRLCPEGEYEGRSYTVHYVRTSQKVVTALERLAEMMHSYFDRWESDTTIQPWQNKHEAELTLPIVHQLAELISDWLQLVLDTHIRTQTAIDKRQFLLLIEQKVQDLRTRGESLTEHLQQDDERWLLPHIARLFIGPPTAMPEPVITKYDHELTAYVSAFIQSLDGSWLGKQIELHN